MNEIPFNPDEISKPGDLNAVRVEESQEPIVREVELGEKVVLKAPNGGELDLGVLGPATGYVGYDKAQKVLFGAVFDTRGDVSVDLQKFQAQLSRQGVTITEDAIAGANQYWTDEQREGTEHIDLVHQGKQNAATMVKRNFFRANKMTEFAVDDTLGVKLEQGNFSIEHQEVETYLPE
ncbi:MAG: hypothetical protein Q8P13_03305 [bacterium]|nr:hypothetical protein [bacterium]